MRFKERVGIGGKAEGLRAFRACNDAVSLSGLPPFFFAVWMVNHVFFKEARGTYRSASDLTESANETAAIAPLGRSENRPVLLTCS